MGGLFVGPQRPHRRHVVVGATTPVVEGHPEGVELLLEPADADAELHAPAGQCVEGGELLGEHQWVALGHDEDAGRQLDA